ncbi:MAG TPA: hypothetical protein VMC08_06690 [Bacteroidales bacterium]|nr:hypothetical protein [Bacteroidales bacterium]
MKTKALFLLLPILFLAARPLPAQTVFPDTSSQGIGPSANTFGFDPHKTQVHVQAGTWFSTSSGYGSAWGTYLSPQLSYTVSPRFRVSGGVSITTTSLNGYTPYYDFYSSGPYHGDVTSAYLWISGQYLVNDRLSISGTVFKKVNIYESPGLNNPYLKDEPYGGNLDVQYRLGKNVFLEGSIGYSRGSVNPYYGSPYSPYSAYSPVGPLYSPFYPGH